MIRDLFTVRVRAIAHYNNTSEMLWFWSIYRGAPFFSWKDTFWHRIKIAPPECILNHPCKKVERSRPVTRCMWLKWRQINNYKPIRIPFSWLFPALKLHEEFPNNSLLISMIRWETPHQSPGCSAMWFSGFFVYIWVHRNYH